VSVLKRLMQNRWTLPVGGLIFGLAAVLILGLLLRPHRYGGTVLQSPQPAYDFTLTGGEGQPVSLHDLRGKLVLLFFGYTACPDVCPTTLREVGAALDILGKRANGVQPVFISVDPEKDTPQRMQAYLANVNPRVLGLTSDLETITLTASQYGIFFQKQEYGTKGSYTVDHTATLLLLDKEGYLRVVYPYGTPAEAIASDIQYLLKQ